MGRKMSEPPEEILMQPMPAKSKKIQCFCTDYGFIDHLMAMSPGRTQQGTKAKIVFSLRRYDEL